MLTLLVVLWYRCSLTGIEFKLAELIRTEDIRHVVVESPIRSLVCMLLSL